MGQRVTLEQAARLAGRAEKTIRAWLQEEPPALSVVYGHWRGGVRAKGGKTVKGRTRLLDVDELERVNAERGGTWHPEHLPPPDIDALAEEITALKARVRALEEMSGQNTLPRFTRPAPYVMPAADQIPTPVLRQPQINATYKEPLVYSDPTNGTNRSIDMLRARRPKRHRKRDKAPLPDGWMELPARWIAVSAFSIDHGLDTRSIDRAPFEGEKPMPMPELAPEGHPWGRYSEPKNRWYPTKVVYRDDQLVEAVQLARQNWPKDWHPCRDAYCPCEKPDFPANGAVDGAHTFSTAGVAASRDE